MHGGLCHSGSSVRHQHQHLAHAPSLLAAAPELPTQPCALRQLRRPRRRACTALAQPPTADGQGKSTQQQQQQGGGPAAYDVLGLSNLCVDIITPVDSLPPQEDMAARRQLLTQLTARPPSEDSWQVGGNANFLIAAARLGLRTGCVGHLGDDVYGRFMHQCLQEEGVTAMEHILVPPPPHPASPQPPSPTGGNPASAEAEAAAASLAQQATLLCFVLVNAAGKHSFCSLYDLGPWPLLRGISTLPAPATALLRAARAVFMNGFVFDELPVEAVCAACSDAMQHGAAVFFDPGPRCFTMKEGARREALEALLRLSTVVLMTEEEAELVTGHSDPEAAARAVLSSPGARTEWCVVKLGAQGALLSCKQTGETHRAQGFTVPVKDTVGCGDSFASAVVLGYIQGLPPPLILALANAVGAATAMGRGAGRSVANASQVRALLESSLGDARQPYSEEVLRQAIAIVDAAMASRGSGQAPEPGKPAAAVAC